MRDQEAAGGEWIEIEASKCVSRSRGWSVINARRVLRGRSEHSAGTIAFIDKSAGDRRGATLVCADARTEGVAADAALSFIKSKGLSDRRAQLIWDLVALNSTPSLALHKEPEVAVGTMGIGLDLPWLRR